MDSKRTKKEVFDHLLNVGYQREEIEKIMAFLVGFGYKKIGEPVPFKTGIHTYPEFVKWMEGNTQQDMCKEIATALDYFISHVKATEQIKEKTWNQITWLSKNNDFIEKCFKNKKKIERFLESTKPLQQDTADRISRFLEALNYDLEKCIEGMEESEQYRYPKFFRK